MKKRRKSKPVVFLLAAAWCAMSIGLTVLFLKNVQPQLKSVCVSLAKNEISQIVDSEVQKVMLEELFTYDKVVNISRDEQGRVTSVSTNAGFINKFTNDLGIEVGNALDELCVSEHYIYLSSIAGSGFFNGRGPKIPVRFCPISVAGADITHRFEEAGINQTLHTVDLTVNVEMEVLAPFAYSRIEASSSMPIAQTLIVGLVPQSYFNKK